MSGSEQGRSEFGQADTGDFGEKTVVKPGKEAQELPSRVPEKGAEGRGPIEKGPAAKNIEKAAKVVDSGKKKIVKAPSKYSKVYDVKVPESTPD